MTDLTIQECDVCEKEPEQGSVLPLIKKKYMWVMILILVVWAFLPSFFTGTVLIVSLVLLALLLGACFLMYNDLYCFQKFGFKYRPFVVTGYFKIISIILCGALLILTIPMAIKAPEVVPYVVLWILAGLIPYQFQSMFWTAKTFKESDPTKCEFC